MSVNYDHLERSLGYHRIATYAVVFFLIFLSLVVIVTVGQTSQTKVGISPKAEVSNMQQASAADIDPQTGEYYDLEIESSVNTKKNVNAGPMYLATTTFKLGGAPVQNISKLYGYIQKPATPYESNPINFQLQGYPYPRFISIPTDLLNNNCIDLHSSPARTQQDYIATFCYRITFVEPNTPNGTAYSYLANPYIQYNYIGTKATTIEFLTTAFNKYNNPPPYDGGNLRGTRVNYLTIDSENSSLNDFSSVKYFIQGITGGLNSQDYNRLCNVDIGLPKKYLKQTYIPKPEGGNNFEITAPLGACNFEYDSSYLKPFYLSLNMEGGLPYPSPSPTISPSLTPTTTVAPTPIISPTPSNLGACKCSRGTVVKNNCNKTAVAVCTGKFNCTCSPCTPRPKCLDAKFPCKLPEPSEGWCLNTN